MAYKHTSQFSEILSTLISNIYSTNSTVANDNFIKLVNYFAEDKSTAAERDFLVMTNNNSIVDLLSDLKENPKHYELLRMTVGKVVHDTAVSALKQYEQEDSFSDLESDSTDTDITGESE